MKICYVTEMPFDAEKMKPELKNQSVLFVQMMGLNAAHYYLKTIQNNPDILNNYDACIFIYPKSRPDSISLVREIKKRTKLILNQEGPRDFWYDWKPNYQALLLEAFRMCDMFFANNKEDLEFFKGYMGDKRKKLVQKFGYDTKNASHLIRLLRMGTEFLLEGDLKVFRDDAQELLDIKLGKWSLDEVKKEANNLFGFAKEAYELSPLNANVDRNLINDLCVDVIKTAYWERNKTW